MMNQHADQETQGSVPVSGELEVFIAKLRQDSPGLADFALRHYARDPVTKFVKWKPRQPEEQDYLKNRLRFGVWMIKNWQYFGDWKNRLRFGVWMFKNWKFFGKSLFQSKKKSGK